MAAAEQRPQQDELGVAGVLVLVEQHDLVAAAFGRADLGMAGRDPGGDRHLVAVVDDLTLGLGPRVPGHHGQQLLPGPLAVQDLAHQGGQLARAGAAACACSQSPTAITSSGVRRCSASSPASISTAAVTAGGDQVTASIGPPYPATTRAAICQATAGVISRSVGSSASRSAWSATSRAA